jgi:ATP-dependent protease ClpP protease subunit
MGGAEFAARAGSVIRSRRTMRVASQIPARATDPRMGQMRERSVPLRGRLGKEAAACCIARFLVLAAENSTRPIITYVGSSGGVTSEALAVISTMNGIRCPIATYSTGMVGGPAIAIAAHGLKGFRGAAPATRFDFGEFESEGVKAVGNDSLLTVFAENLARDTGKSPAEVLGWVSTGASFTAEQALKHGLIDAIANNPTLPEIT